jgi:competence protein ComEC
VRLFIPVALAWSAGVGIEAASPLPWWAYAATGVGTLTAAALARRRRRTLAAIVVVAAVAAGALAAARTRARVAEGPAWPDAWPPAARQVEILEGEVAGAVEAAEPGWRALVDVDTVVAQDGTRRAAAARLLVRWDAAGRPPLFPGDRVRLAGAVRAPRGFADEGAFDRARFLGGHGVDGLCAAEAPGPVRLATPPRASAARLAARVRAALIAKVAAVTSGDGGGFVLALVLGDRGAIRPGVDDAFRRAGVTHVLSVSGLHLAAVALLLFALVRRAWLYAQGRAAQLPAEAVAAAVAAPAAIVYTLVTGAEVATVRSLVATLVVLGGAALGRRPHALTALAVAALVLLADAPWTVFEPSFQLSFVAAAALVTLGTRLAPAPAAPEASRARRVAVGLLRLAAASFAAALATAPLTALHFGVIQPAGLVANLVVVPVAEFLILPLGLAGALLAAIWAPLGLPCLALAGTLAAALVRVVGAIASVAPVLEVPPPGALELVALAIALGALALLRPLRRALLTAALATAVAAASFVNATYVAPARRTALAVTFLDVGQGDSAVVELPGGDTWLVDAGGRLFGAPGPDAGTDEHLAALAGDPGEQAVWRFLHTRRVGRLALVVVSHPHPDHYGGLAAVAAHLPIDELWLGGDETNDPAWRALLARLAANGTRIVRPPLGVARVTHGARLLVLAPRGSDDATIATPSGRGVNDDSLVVRLEFAGRALLFAGDLESDGEAALVASTPPAWLRADVVKVPHHGSRTSSSAAFVRATAPGLAVVSCGVANRFGFPAAEVVARWRAAAARVLGTDQAGAVTIRIQPDGALQVSTFITE